MRRLDPAAIDLPTSAALAGGAATEHLLAALRERGHPRIRPTHGYVVDAEDSRIRRVALTRSGRLVIERARAARAELEARVVAEVGPRVVENARRALAALLSASGATEAVVTRRVRLPS